MTDGNGLPLAVIVTAANVHDSKVALRVVDAIPPLRLGVGRPRKRPLRLKGDKGYDSENLRKELYFCLIVSISLGEMIGVPRALHSNFLYTAMSSVTVKEVVSPIYLPASTSLKNPRALMESGVCPRSW